MKEKEIRIVENARIKISATEKEIIIEDRDRFGELRRYVWFKYDEFDMILKVLQDMEIIEDGRINQELKI